MNFTPEQLEQMRRAAAAINALNNEERSQVFDAAFPESRPAPHQWEFFRTAIERNEHDEPAVPIRYIRGGNQSSKTSTACRELAWIMTDTHPLGFKRPKRWGTGPLTAIVAAQSLLSAEEEIWTNKLKPFFGPEWEEERKNGYLRIVRNVKNGNRIIFLSHADSSEQNRKYMQGFVAHYVLLDEMPTSFAILEELERRIDSRKGLLVGAFTPKVFNGAVKRRVDALQMPAGRVFRFSKFQNPLFAGREEDEWAKLEGLPEHVKRCVLFGEWMPGEGLVFWYEPERHATRRHPQYSKDWEHVLVVDPATESKLGFLLVYRIPETARRVDWAPPPGAWVVKTANYVEGIYVPTKIVDEVEGRVRDVRLIERVSDPAATWYIRQAAEMPDGRKYEYSGVPSKNMEGRKDEMLASSQGALGVSVWVEDHAGAGVGETGDTSFLIDELGTMSRSPHTNQIVKAKKYHLIDCLNYFVDRLPYARPTAQVTDLTTQTILFNQWRGAPPGTPPPAEIASVVNAVSALNQFRVQVSGPLGGHRRRLA